MPMALLCFILLWSYSHLTPIHIIYHFIMAWWETDVTPLLELNFFCIVSMIYILRGSFIGTWEMTLFLKNLAEIFDDSWSQQPTTKHKYHIYFLWHSVLAYHSCFSHTFMLILHFKYKYWRWKNTVFSITILSWWKKMYFSIFNTTNMSHTAHPYTTFPHTPLQHTLLWTLAMKMRQYPQRTHSLVGGQQ